MRSAVFGLPAVALFLATVSLPARLAWTLRRPPVGVDRPQRAGRDSAFGGRLRPRQVRSLVLPAGRLHHPPGVLARDGKNVEDKPNGCQPASVCQPASGS